MFISASVFITLLIMGYTAPQMKHLHEAGGAGGQMAMGMIYHSTAAIKQAIVHINGLAIR
jgi:hypothetical protein